ncbi:MAG: Dihydrolipoyl dehydrogenase 3 [Alphaproteobacteria bacterium MarineAlpha4_Bin2]|nr:MAG: Dihydrolipoyl dehydrogenase 3 [Alphaproteobacteria bacterium MarineAlpha4_Bin2]
MAESFDLIVIGGGPGGYVAAIRAAQLGLKTACVEKRGTLGGTCLNVGCIPSKALLYNSHLYAEAVYGFKERGIEVGQVKLNLKKLMGNKDKIVGDLTKGIEFLFKKNKVDYLQGIGAINAPGKVTVTQGGNKETYETKNILIATGSDSALLPNVDIDEKQIVSSTGALSLAKVPQHLAVIGGGVIGLELGSVWARFGAKVTVVEFLDRILPTNDGEVSEHFQRILEKQGFTFRLSTKVTGAKKARNGVTLMVEPAAGGDTETIKADVVLLSIGRVPYTEGLGLDNVGVQMDSHGVIQIDSNFQTNVSGIYAIGDCISGPMLAHKAEDEGLVVAEILAGQSGHIDYDAVPGIVYTWPEVAFVGKSEEELKEAGLKYKLGKFPFVANSRARCNGDMDGFVKILANAETDAVLGCHIIGADAGNLIQEIVTVIEFGGSAEDIARTCHGHPTMTEAIKEAALAVDGRPIHI